MEEERILVATHASNLPEEEKRRLLWEAIGILLRAPTGEPEGGPSPSGSDEEGRQREG